MAEPAIKNFHIRRGTKFGPVVIQLGPIEPGEAVDLADAIVRIQTGSGSRDSTVANGEIAIDDDALTVTWTMLEDATAELTTGPWTGALIVIDSDGQDREPLDLSLQISGRIPAP